MANYSLCVKYDGAPFSGFARQPGQLTVQGEIESALSLLFKREVLVVCAGRTDAGVHARAQVVSFELYEDEVKDMRTDRLLRSLNALTHEAISLYDFKERCEDFSARFNAAKRSYKYFLSISEQPPLFMKDFSWYIGPKVNVDAMRTASQYLIGEHDFKSFCLAASAKGKTTMRCVNAITIEETRLLDEPYLVVTVEGNAFLHSMVRTIVGSLVMVGKGHREPEWMDKALKACNRSAAGETAPAAGLVFWEVEYPEDSYYEDVMQ